VRALLEKLTGIATLHEAGGFSRSDFVQAEAMVCRPMTGRWNQSGLRVQLGSGS
jgi:hypothetical protein